MAKKMGNNARTAINIISSFGTTIFGLLISFFLSPYIVRTIGVVCLVDKPAVCRTLNIGKVEFAYGVRTLRHVLVSLGICGEIGVCGNVEQGERAISSGSKFPDVFLLF